MTVCSRRLVSVMSRTTPTWPRGSATPAVVSDRHRRCRDLWRPRNLVLLTRHGARRSTSSDGGWTALDPCASRLLHEQVRLEPFSERAGRGPRIVENQVVAAAVAETPRCLLYTSDAADERSSVDLGGRRI